MRLTIIIPTLDEAPLVDAALARLAPLRRRGAQVVVADGGSQDDTVARASSGPDAADRVIAAPRGRALQMNAGARTPQAEAADVLLFLHVDTALPDEADRLIFRGLSNQPCRWGRFDVTIEGQSRLLPAVAFLMNQRSAWSGIATGDQAMFAERGLFLAMEGFASIALMEDIEFSDRARRITAPLRIRIPVRTDGRRWDRDGAWRTVLHMWRLRAAYAMGADPADLAQRYRHVR